jgi:signal transduction histidine kinase
MPIFADTSKLWRNKPSSTQVFLLALLVTCLFGVLDDLSDRDLVISALYLIPVCWVTWSVGARAGCLLSALSVVFWLISDYRSGYGYSHPLIPVWNAMMMMATFLLAVSLLSAVRRSYLGLEETVASRTLELRKEIEERRRAESEKIQAERLAMVGMMAAQVAHEVRNPLGAIALTLDLLENEMEKISAATGQSLEESTELAGALREEVKRIDQVILDYLSLARPRKATFARVDLNDLVQRKLAFLNGVMSEANVTLDLRLQESPLLIRADGDQIWQAILNIVKNSLEAMPEGGTLTVEISSNAPSAVVRLTDTGCGMATAQKEKLFVPFATSKANGTGLGLALVKQIVTEHNGRIECQSAPGQGTSFTITLPLEQHPVRKESQPSRPTNSPQLHLTPS